MAALHKRPFEFRMCKKVAELTQVIHMLFTRNHEREVELEATKEAYEEEINRVLRESDERISVYKTKYQELQFAKELKQDRKKQEVNEEAVKFLNIRNKELEEKINDLEVLASERRNECNEIKVLLNKAESHVEKLKELKTEDLRKNQGKCEEITAKNEKLKGRISILEKELRDSQQSSERDRLDLQRLIDQLRRENEKYRNCLVDNEKSKQQLLAKVKQLENDLKRVKKQLLLKKQSQQTNDRRNSYFNGNEDDEIDKLRNEVARYKMELSNRENNFNRVFSDIQPVLLDRRSQNQARKYSTGTQMQSLHSYPNDLEGRLPQLGYERSRSGTLIRSRSLSREMSY
ncbi:unnamed protein product [Dimorphilus gyrociliatus]|uniref:Uncharacterized protein n=1 Tax=Dimorphilus gyrociliatus TaxID=2664684 RepID=A0A7I8VUZ7_9ANNE|nr:unnamed protein product [Dimorphilus gyrociliatus]